MNGDLMAMLRVVSRMLPHRRNACCRWLTSDSDADSYYGPGGLSARQLFDQVQRSRLKEASGARQQGQHKHEQQARRQPEQTKTQEYEEVWDHERGILTKRPKKAAKQQPRAQTRLTDQQISSASSKELRQLLTAKSIDVSDCFERSELVERARAHLL